MLILDLLSTTDVVAWLAAIHVGDDDTRQTARYAQIQLLPSPMPLSDLSLLASRCHACMKCLLIRGLGISAQKSCPFSRFNSADWGFLLEIGKWGISVFIVLLIRSSTVLACALFELARNGQNPWGNRYALHQFQTEGAGQGLGQDLLTPNFFESYIDAANTQICYVAWVYLRDGLQAQPRLTTD